MKKSISVIGAGGWGTALAKMLAEKAANPVTLWVRQEKQARDIAEKRVNNTYLPTVVLPENLAVTSDIVLAAKSGILVIATPSQAVRDISRRLSSLLLPGQILLSCAKGLEEGSFLRMSEVIKNECPFSSVAVLSGPNHAEEVGQRQPTATVIASEDAAVKTELQDIFSTPYFRPYTSSDTVGVELGGAFKNIIALALGMLSGLGFQDNIKAATMTRGLAEITRLGLAMGAQPATFAGLAGTGDLIATCISAHSRNRWAGEQLAKGFTVEEITQQTNMVVEGIRATKAAFLLAEKLSIEMPITNELYKVIYQKKDVKTAVFDLMSREYKAEI